MSCKHLPIDSSQRQLCYLQVLELYIMIWFMLLSQWAVHELYIMLWFILLSQWAVLDSLNQSIIYSSSTAHWESSINQSIIYSSCTAHWESSINQSIIYSSSTLNADTSSNYLGYRGIYFIMSLFRFEIFISHKIFRFMVWNIIHFGSRCLYQFIYSE
jgi:hypothetical protein